VAIIIPANSAAVTAYSIDNSCRFNDGDSARLSKDFGTPTSQKIWTYSVWLKNSQSGPSEPSIFSSNDEPHGGTNVTHLFFAGSDILWSEYQSGTEGDLRTDAKYRDPSAWMHIVFRWDSTNGTAGDRMRLYVNGTEVTSFSSDVNPDQNLDSKLNVDGVQHDIGNYNSTATYFDGYMAECIFCDGQSLAPTEFGEFDEDSPTIWKPKDPSGVTFGNNGFWLDFEDSSALGNDVSGNNNDFTATNLAAADQATDTPTNNFCTLNPLIRQVAEETGGLSEGNTEVLFSGASWGGVSSTMAPAAGKWYFEGKLIANGSNSIIGVVPANTQGKDNTGTWYIGQYSGEQAYQNNGAASNGGASFGNTYTDGDIIGVALDCDNAKVYFSKNGTLENSGDPSSGATGTGAMSLTAGEFYTPAVSGNGVTNWEMNFGNPPYANSSDAADANGYGAFEYAPPSGYLALCTKNLGSDGG